MKLRFALATLVIGLVTTPLMAQTLTVGYQQRLEVRAPGATAAYSLNSFYADASVSDGIVTVQGNNPGTTTIVVITGIGVQTFRVSIPQPAAVYPPGFERPRGKNYEDGSYEVRYSSDPSQLLNTVDFVSHQDDRVIRFHVVNSNYLTDAGSGSPIGLPSLSYEIDTPRRDVTLVDQNVVNSPLTLENVLVRGFHLREGSWFFHGGYTAQSMFQNLLLPTQRDTVIGTGYRIHWGKNATLTPNVYYIDASSGLGSNGHSGTVASLVYRYEVKNRLNVLAETGWGNGMGAAGRLEYQRQSREHLSANLRYEPSTFNSVAVNNLHGFLSDLRWDRNLSEKAVTSVAFSGNRYDYSQSAPQVNISSDWNVNYQLAKHWSATSGVDYSRFTGIGNSGYLQNVQIPVGGNFTSSHFSAGALYSASVSESQGQLGNGIRGNLTVSARGWHLSTYVDRETNVPTVASLVSSVPGLQDLLNRLGIAATTPQQISDLLNNEAFLQQLGLVNGISLNLSPVLLQSGVTLNWSGRSPSRQQLYLSFLYNSNQMPNSTQQSAIYSATYSRRLTKSNSVFASYSLFRSKSPGVSSSYQPLAEFSLRHSLNSVPSFLMPGRKGTISGTVFHDLQLEGVFREGMPLLAGVEITLDGTRHTMTDSAGRYSFTRVPFGSHRLQAKFSSERPSYFTTQSDATTEVDTTVNFGVTFNRARLIGHVQNDAGVPILGVGVTVTGAQRIYTATTDADGKFTLADLEEGSYKAEIRSESLPTGYLSDDLEPVDGDLKVGAPTHITFTVKAIRSIGGKVRTFDPATGREIPITGVKVRVAETGAESTTDQDGNYLFRQMPAGTFTLTISYQGGDFRLSVSLPPTPAFSRGNDFTLGRN